MGAIFYKMKFLGIILVLSLMIFLIWHALTVKPKPDIVLMNDGGFFKRIKRLIRYNSVLKIEKDIGMMGASSRYIDSYVITYLSTLGEIESIRFYLKRTDEKNWKTFRERVQSANSQAEFDNSIF